MAKLKKKLKTKRDVIVITVVRVVTIPRNSFLFVTIPHQEKDTPVDSVQMLLLYCIRTLGVRYTVLAGVSLDAV